MRRRAEAYRSAAGVIRRPTAGGASAAALAVMWLLLTLAPRELPAQGAWVNLDVGASHARPPSEVAAEASSYLLLGGRLTAGGFFGAAYGALAADPASASWGSVVLGGRGRVPVVRGFDLGLSAVGSAFALGDPTPYRGGTLRVDPEARVFAGGTEAIIRGHAGIGRSEVTDSVITDLWLYGGAFELGQRSRILGIHLGVEAYSSAGGSYRAAYARSRVALRRARWNLEFRIWDTPGDVEPQVNVNLAIPLGRAWTVEMAGGRSGPDPLLNSPPGINGSLVLSWNLFAPRTDPLPVYILGDHNPIVVIFRLERRDAHSVSVTGDFSGWQPIAMRREGGVWQARVSIEPGVYHFGFLADGEWYVPDNAPGKVTDDFGRANATLVVPAR